MATNVDEHGLPASRLWQPVTVGWFGVVFGASLGYAVVRYHLAGDVPWRHFPLFIVNKALSLASVLFIAASYLVGKVIRWHDHDKALRLVVVKFCGLMGFFFAVIHTFLSFVLLTPAYFPKYFTQDGRLTGVAELAILVGALGLFFLLSPAITTLPMMPKALGGWRWKRSQRLGYIALALVVVHLVCLGLNGWLTPSGWPKRLPPISLVAVMVAMVPLVVRHRRQRTKTEGSL